MLGDSQIMHFQAQPRDTSGIGILDPYQTITLPPRQNGGPLTNTLRVIAVEFVERGTLADTPIDEVSKFGTVQGKQIRLGRHQERQRCVGKLSKNRLAANHDDLGIVGDRSGSADQVLKL